MATRACFTSSKTRHQHQGGGINGCDVLKSGGLLFTAGGDGSVLVWDGKNLEVLHALEDIHGGSPVLCVRCDTYGRYITSSGHDGSTKVVDLRMMREVVVLWACLKLFVVTIAGSARLPCDSHFLRLYVQLTILNDVFCGQEWWVSWKLGCLYMCH